MIASSRADDLVAKLRRLDDLGVRSERQDPRREALVRQGRHVDDSIQPSARARTASTPATPFVAHQATSGAKATVAVFRGSPGPHGPACTWSAARKSSGGDRCPRPGSRCRPRSARVGTSGSRRGRLIETDEVPMAPRERRARTRRRAIGPFPAGGSVGEARPDVDPPTASAACRRFGSVRPRAPEPPSPARIPSSRPRQQLAERVLGRDVSRGADGDEQRRDLLGRERDVGQVVARLVDRVALLDVPRVGGDDLDRDADVA